MSFERNPQQEQAGISERAKRKLTALTQIAALGISSLGFGAVVKYGPEFYDTFLVYHGNEEISKVEGARGGGPEVKKEEEKKEKAADKIAVIEKLLQEPRYHILLERFGGDYLEGELVALSEEVEQHQGNKNENEPGVAVDAIETRDGTLQWSQAQDSLANLPHGWVVGKVDSMHFLAGVERADKGYTKNGVLADIGFAKELGKSKIRFFDSARTQTIEYVLEAIDHEIGHANDWKRKPELSTQERLDFLLAVSDRSFSADRYHSNYVESIEEKNPGQMNYDKTTEYWAEICSAYFNHPQDLNVKDFTLVDGFVKKADPNYNPTRAAEFNHALAEAVHSRSTAK